MKKLIKTGIIVIILLASVCAAVLYLYSQTDMFKSEKQLFNQYAMKMDLDEFIDVELDKEIIEKANNESNKSIGKLSIKLKDAVDEEFDYEFINNIQTKNYSGTISMKQGGVEKLSANVIKEDDLLGIKMIFDQILVFRNSNLKELARKFNLPDEFIQQIPDKIDLSDVDIQNDKELQDRLLTIYKKYFNNIISQIPEEKYETLEKQEITVDGNTIVADGYKFEIRVNELEEMILNCLKDARDDKELFDLVSRFIINKEITFEEYQKIIDEVINSREKTVVNDTTEVDDSLKISVIMYTKNKELVQAYAKCITTDEENEYSKTKVLSYFELTYDYTKRFEFKEFYKSTNSENDFYNYEEESSIVFDKSKDNPNTYNINVSTKIDGEEEYSIKAVISEKKIDSQNYKLYANLNISSKEEKDYIVISYENTTTFDNNLEPEKLNKENSIIINDLTAEQIMGIINMGAEELVNRIDFSKTLVGNLLMGFGGGILVDENDSQSQSPEKIKSAIREAVSTTEADIMTDYYYYDSPLDKNNPPSNETVENYLNSNLPYNISLIVPYDPIINADGTTWIIKIDPFSLTEDNMDLANEQFELTVNLWKNNF